MSRLISFIIAFTASLIPVNTNENIDYNDISVYKQRLEDFNEEHGTMYGIPDEFLDGGDIVEFYTSMSLEEFDRYIMSIYDGSYYDTERPAVNYDDEGKLSIRHEIPAE